MQREIKLRVWGAETQKMYYLGHGLSLHFNGNKNKIPWGLYDDINEVRLVTGDINAIINEPGKLMQFTGLRDDIKGKEPYEGDIVKYYLDSGIEGDDTQTEYIEAIEWVGCGFELDGVPLTLLEDWPFEIIGNIYETPQFLK